MLYIKDFKLTVQANCGRYLGQAHSFVVLAELGFGLFQEGLYCHMKQIRREVLLDWRLIDAQYIAKDKTCRTHLKLHTVSWPQIKGISQGWYFNKHTYNVCLVYYLQFCLHCPVQGSGYRTHPSETCTCRDQTAGCTSFKLKQKCENTFNTESITSPNPCTFLLELVTIHDYTDHTFWGVLFG